MAQIFQRTADLLGQMLNDSSDGLNTYSVSVDDQESAESTVILLARTLRHECLRTSKDERLGITVDEEGDARMLFGKYGIGYRYDADSHQLIVTTSEPLPAAPMLNGLREAHEALQEFKKKGAAHGKVFDLDRIAANTAAYFSVIAPHYRHNPEDVQIEKKGAKYQVTMPHALHHKLKQNEPLKVPHYMIGAGDCFCDLMTQFKSMDTPNPSFDAPGNHYKMVMSILLTGLHALLKTNGYMDVLKQMSESDGSHLQYGHSPFKMVCVREKGKIHSHISCERTLPYQSLIEWYNRRAEEFGRIKPDINGLYTLALSDPDVMSQHFIILLACATAAHLDVKKHATFTGDKGRIIRIQIDAEGYEILRRQYVTEQVKKRAAGIV